MCQAKINLKACKEFVLLLRTCATQNHLIIFSVIYTRALFSLPILRLQQNWKNAISEHSMQKRNFVVALKPVLFTNLCMVHAIILIGETSQQIGFINLPFFPSDVLMYVYRETMALLYLQYNSNVWFCKHQFSFSMQNINSYANVNYFLREFFMIQRNKWIQHGRVPAQKSIYCQACHAWL